MAYQGAIFAITKCDLGKFILVRFEGTAAKVSNAPKTRPARRAKVG